MASMTRTEQVEYFKSGLEFLKKEYPSFHVVDSRIHYDEKGLPHCHTSMLPIYEKTDGSKSFNVTACQKGRDYFRGFQDRFYEYMKERYPEKNLQRLDPERDHNRKMSVKEYKENQDFKRELEQERQRLLARNEQLKEIDQQMTAAIAERQLANRYNQEVERYCHDNGLTITQYEKQVFWANRDVGSYPEPERYNPDRQQEQPELEREVGRAERER